MHVVKSIILAFALCFTLPGSALASTLDPHAEDRQALIKVFREIEAGINAQDIERMVAQMAPDATVIWLNGEVSRGHDEIRAYYRRMVSGPDRILEKYTTAAELGSRARFFGEVAVADGSMQDAFFPVARKPFVLRAHWSSTSARLNGQWKVVSLHLSANVFNNTLIDEARSAAWFAAGGGVLGGLVLAAGVCWRRRHTRANQR